jgi:hypothetical protein
VLCEEILGEFGGRKEEQTSKYFRLLLEVCGQEKRILEGIRYGLVLGSDKFINWVQKKFVNRRSKNEELPQQRMLGDDKM